MIFFMILSVLLSIVLVISLVLFFSTRYFYKITLLRKPTATLDDNINANTDWSKHLEFIVERKKWLEDKPKEEVFITSFDGLKLHATVIEADENNKKCVICFHGFTSKGMSDYGAIAKFYLEQGFNMIIPDARNHGESEGKYTGFGVLDRFDAQKWVEYAVNRYGSDVKIFLHGVSMGAATVLMASGLDLPENVKTIIADCGFTSAYDVFSHILKLDYHIPKFPIMNLTELMTKRKAGYGYNDVSTLNEVAKTKIPILFIHGEVDDFVPVWMSEKNYEVCASEKELLIVNDADHAESYYCATEQIENTIKKYMEKYT